VLPGVEFPLMLLAPITTSLPAPELPVLSTGNTHRTKQLGKANFELHKPTINADDDNSKIITQKQFSRVT
jgi:hypothetical protein